MIGNRRSERGLTRRQEGFLSKLLTLPSVAAAAKATDVPEPTARRWLRDPAFLTAYREARRQQVEHSSAIIQAATTAAVSALLRAVGEHSPQALQVRAAAIILDHAARAVEIVDLVERIEHLEAQIEQRARGGPFPVMERKQRQV